MSTVLTMEIFFFVILKKIQWRQQFPNEEYNLL